MCWKKSVDFMEYIGAEIARFANEELQESVRYLMENTLVIKLAMFVTCLINVVVKLECFMYLLAMTYLCHTNTLTS